MSVKDVIKSSVYESLGGGHAVISIYNFLDTFCGGAYRLLHICNL